MNILPRVALAAIAALVFLSCTKESNTSSRVESSFNDSWKYRISDKGEWSETQIPHIPKIEPLVVNDQWQGNIWYEKTFAVTSKNRKYFLEFEGVMHEAQVWLNDQNLGTHAGGYLPFIFDISALVKVDEPNRLEIKVNNEDNPVIPPGKTLKTLDFNYYGGIYRSVNLIETSNLHITHPLEADRVGGGGTLYHFDEVSDTAASGSVRVHVKNDDSESTITQVVLTLENDKGAHHSFESKVLLLAAYEEVDIHVPLKVKHPELWSIYQPNLYHATAKLFRDGVLVDEQSEKIGIRKIELSAQGFFLNGEKVFIRGTNRHQEYPYLGYAISQNANRRDAIKIKQAGFDFVRLSHYPQDETFLDACDELGILVMNAIPGWQFFAEGTFSENAFNDIKDMVRRDRNHASVVFWEVSLNESSMSADFMNQANELLKQEMPFSDTYSAGWIDHESYDLYIPARQHGKAPDYWKNYKTGERPLFIAEYGDWEYYAQNAGFNQKAFKDLKADERTSRQLRGSGEKRLLQQALNFQEAANSNRKGSNTIGHANWLMFDYNRGYADDIESSGISDIFRIPKFAYYFYQSQRDPEDTLALSNATGAMVKIASYWNAESSSKVRVYSNCEEVALYLNDSLVGKSMPDQNEYTTHLPHPPFHFDLKTFEKGNLTAVGYIKGEEAAEETLRTPEEPTDIVLDIDESTVPISETVSDVVFLYAKIVDENGTLVPKNDIEVSFEVTGAELIGENPVKTEAGMASILLKTRTSENIKLHATTHFAETDYELRK